MITPRVLGFQITTEVSLERADGGLLRPVVRVMPETLAEELVRYWRWCAEGKLPYHTSYVPREQAQRRQYYYDDYHNHIEWHPETGDYSFRIQTHDSPEGDTWWQGRFTFENGDGIKVTKSQEVPG